MVTKVELPMTSIMKSVTLDVHITRQTEWKIRQWAGIQLLKLSAFVMGCGVRIEMNP